MVIRAGFAEVFFFIEALKQLYYEETVVSEKTKTVDTYLPHGVRVSVSRFFIIAQTVSLVKFLSSKGKFEEGNGKIILVPPANSVHPFSTFPDSSRYILERHSIRRHRE